MERMAGSEAVGAEEFPWWLLLEVAGTWASGGLAMELTLGLRTSVLASERAVSHLGGTSASEMAVNCSTGARAPTVVSRAGGCGRCGGCG